MNKKNQFIENLFLHYCMTEFTQTIHYNIIRYTSERSTGKLSLHEENHKPIYEKENNQML